MEYLAKLPEVKRLTTLSKAAIYAGLRDQTFPKPVKVGARAVAWPLSSIQQWIEQRIAESRNGGER